MRITLNILLLLTICTSVKAQTYDYSDVRDSMIAFSCGQVDIETVYKARGSLLTLDTTQISKDLYLYYRDIANCYYRIWPHSKNKKNAYLAIEYNKKAINKNPDFDAAYWDIALIHYFLGECDKGDTYWNLYKSKTKETEDDIDQIKQLKTLCAVRKNKN